MTQAATIKWRVSKKVVHTIQILIVILCAVLFAYLYKTNTQLETLGQTLVDNQAPVFNRMIYGGFDQDAMSKPMDATVIGQFIYVSDTNNKRVQVFDLTGTSLFKFGKEGAGKGEFKFPYGIDGDSKGNVYVADLYNGSISVFDAKGKFIKYFAENNPNEKVIQGPGALRIINDKVYVTDIVLGEAFVFDLNGKKIATMGKTGPKAQWLAAPNGITCDQEGNIYVVDSLVQRIQIYDSHGKYLRSFNGSKDGKGSSAFVNPRGIGIDSRGIIYVVSSLTHYIYSFDKDGKQLFVFGGDGDANDKFTLPNGLYITPNNEIFITDTANQRVAVYKL